MSETNVFKWYKQEENRFTNGLFSILDLSKGENKSFIFDFFRRNLGIKIPKDRLNFKVLGGYEATADGEISNDKLYFLIETKIKSGSLVEEQIKRHLKSIKKKKEKTKGLILLTPDAPGSEYINQYKTIDSTMIYHLNWKQVYDHLYKCIDKKHESLFTKIISQYLSVIRKTIFDENIVAVIVKIKFGDESSVYEDKYLDEMNRGEWPQWNTPRCYPNLDGKGRKLILYDRTRQALTVEVEIKKVEKTEEEKEYPWSNKFAPKTLRIYKTPISVEKLRKIKGFENFGVHRKDRSPFRNLRHEQYEKLEINPSPR